MNLRVFNYNNLLQKSPIKQNKHYANFIDINTLHVLWIVMVKLTESGLYIYLYKTALTSRTVLYKDR